MEAFRGTKTNVGEPKRVLVHPGDAFIAHQRLAHAAGVNISEIIRKNVYFRIVHAARDTFFHQYIHSDTPWIGFYGLSDILPESVTHAQADDEGCSRYSDEQVHKSGSGSDHCDFKLSRAQICMFKEEGYLVLSDVLSLNLIDKAEHHIRTAYAEGQYHASESENNRQCESAGFWPSVRRNKAISDIFFSSGLVNICESFLGKDNVRLQKSCGFPLRLVKNASYTSLGIGMRDNLPSSHWGLDYGAGQYQAKGSDYNLLLATPLSTGLDIDENRGQLVLWPGELFTYLLHVGSRSGHSRHTC